MPPSASNNGDPKQQDKVEASAPRLAIFAALTLAAIALCVGMTVPFLPALAWALALAIVAAPLHGWLRGRIASPNLAAGGAVGVVLVCLVVPSYFAIDRLTREAAHAGQVVEEQAQQGAIREWLAKVPGATRLLDWATEQLDQDAIRRLLLARAGEFTSVLEGSLGALIQGLLMFLSLFYFFRDAGKLMAGVRELAPLSGSETEALARRVHDAVHATVYGTFVTGLLQGVTGGLLFWLLGLPAPVLWGTVMFLLGILPLVGGILVWAPASVYLVLDGRIGAALLLVAWGVLMAGPVGNYLYAGVAGDRMRMHPLPTLFAYLGGLAVFGVSGMVLGPVALALTLGLIDLWRRRMVPASPAAAPAALTNTLARPVQEERADDAPTPQEVPHGNPN